MTLGAFEVHDGTTGERLTLSRASLVAHALNTLWADGRCCPHDCAPCTALLHLAHDGQLDDEVRPYVATGRSGPNQWWDVAADGVSRSWLLARWCDPRTCAFADHDDVTDQRGET